MKKFLLPITVFVLSLTMIAQGSSSGEGKLKDKSKNEKAINSQEKRTVAEEKKVTAEHSKKIWEGAFNNGPKPSINQPVKVWAAFQRYYPYTIYNSPGNWTVTFGNLLFMSNALNHANGSAKCFGFHIQMQTRYMAGRHYKIETPNTINDIFWITDIIHAKSQYLYYDIDNKLVKNNY